MKIVKFSVMCNAVYYGELMVANELNREEVLEEIRDRLPEVPVNELEWINDLEPEVAVTDEDIIYIGDVEEIK